VNEVLRHAVEPERGRRRTRDQVGDSSVLNVAHLSPPRDYFVGDESTAKGKLLTDFLVSSDAIGTSRLQVVANIGAGVAVIVPSGATGDVTVGDSITSFAVDARGAQPHAMPGAKQYPLPQSDREVFYVASRSSRSRSRRDGCRRRRSAEPDWALVGVGARPAGVHGVPPLMYLMPPSSRRLARAARLTPLRSISSASETVEEETPEWLQQQTTTTPRAVWASVTRVTKADGQNEAKRRNRYGIEGPQDNQIRTWRATRPSSRRTAGILGVPPRQHRRVGRPRRSVATPRRRQRCDERRCTDGRSDR
jgi:hypothetical protein